VLLALTRVEGLSVREAGLAFWPEFLAALAAGVVFGRLVGTRWLVVLGTLGLVLSAAAAAIVFIATPVVAATAPWVVIFAGLGAGFAVTPGIFVVALSFERASVARAVALLNLLRLTGGFISVPGVEHTIGNRTYTRLQAVAEPVRRSATRAFIVTGQHANVPLHALQGALRGALHDALLIVCGLALLGALVNAVILISAHVPMRRPDLAAIDRGEAALTARA
jgi:hypothetical protein